MVGEADEVWPQVTADAVAGRIQGIYNGQAGRPSQVETAQAGSAQHLPVLSTLTQPAIIQNL